MDPTSTVSLLPLIPNNMEPCTSGTDALLGTQGPRFDTGDDDRCPNEGVLTIGEDPEWDEGMVSFFLMRVWAIGMMTVCFFNRMTPPNDSRGDSYLPCTTS